MTGLKTQNRRPAAGDPLDDLLDDTAMKSARARARPRVTYPPSASGSNVWWIAAAASVVWAAAVLAYSWARFALPGDPRSVLDAAQSRVSFTDWLMILATIAGPVLLMWVVAWLVRRTIELRDESRKLAKAAVLLADAAETAEKRAELRLSAPGSVGGELIAQGPGHLHREIERASHAMNALQSQMSSMETALAKQSAAFDNAAERAAARTQALGAAERQTPPVTSAPVVGAAVSGIAGAALLAQPSPAGASVPANKTPAKDAPANEVSDDIDDALELGPELVVAAKEGDGEAVAVDMALAPAPASVPAPPPVPAPEKGAGSDTEKLRQDLLAAGRGVAWTKLVTEDTAPKTDGPARSTPTPIREDAAAARAKPVPAELATIDPFDDLGPSTPKAVLGAGVGAGVALGFGATRDDDKARGPMLGAPQVDEPAPVAQVKTDLMPQRDDLEYKPRALDWRKFVRAANFPENEKDTVTLDALYDVLTDTEAAALLQSSEDTLATLADLDLYMEDFVPEMSPVLSWRGHLEGKTGLVEKVDAPIEKSRIDAKLSADDSFRKLGERFIERYQVVLKRLFAEGADDRLALELADSRTGRAYIMVADALGKL